MSEISYNGQTLSFNAIARAEGLSPDSLIKKYNQTQDIYEAVKLAKESQSKRKESIVQVSYNGQTLTLDAISNLEGIKSETLRKKYSQTQDIYEAVKLTKESQTKRNESITHIPYNGQTLSLKAIAELEGVTYTTLIKKYNNNQDIYEAVKQAKESKQKEAERISKMPYNGQMLSFYAIAKLEGISSSDTLKKEYNRTQDIYEAVRITKENQKTRNTNSISVSYKGQMLPLSEIAKLEGISLTTLNRRYSETQDIDEAVRLAKESQKYQQERTSQIPYNGQNLPLYTIAKLEGLNDKTLRAKYEETQDIYEAIKQAREANLAAKYIDYNGQKLPLTKIAELEGISTRAALKENYEKTKDIYEAIRLTKESQIKKIPYKGQILPLGTIAKEEGIAVNTLKRYYESTQNIEEAVKLAKEAHERQKEKISQIEYNNQILSLGAIAKLEGISHETLKKYYANAQDIYEAVKLAKEGSAKQKESINQIPYNGEMLTIKAIAELEGVTTTTLNAKYKETQDIYQAVELAKEAQKNFKEKIKPIDYNGQKLSIRKIAELEDVNATTLIRKYGKTQDIYEAIKLAKESQAKEKERVSQISYNGKTLSLNAIAELEGVTRETLKRKYDETQDIYEAVKLSKEVQEKTTPIDYKGQKLSLSAIAKLENIDWHSLKRKFDKAQDIEKAVMLCKLLKSRNERRKEIVQTKEFGNLTYYDLSLIIGIKYSELEKLLEQGNSIEDIIDSKEKTDRNITTRENIRLENGQSLTEYCIENKLNYSCIYRAMKIYGKSLEEAVSTYNSQGQQTPTKWIFEKYGLLLKHLMLKEKVDTSAVVSYMRKDYLPMEQAIEKYIIRYNARKYDLDKDWMEELYDVLADDSLSKEDYNGYVQTFYVDDQEENCIKKSKEQYANIKRKILLFELSDVLREGIFTPEEEKRLFEEYSITENEVDVIFNDLYDRFTDPGVLMGKDQESTISPEVEQKRKDQISKYKQMVREINQDNNIVFMMRFMVGPNVESNEECRNELHKELAKEEMKKQDISSNN